MSKRKTLRAILSTILALLIAASGIAMTLAFSVKLGFLNEKVLKSEMSDNSYATQSISVMKEEIEKLVEDCLSDTEGLDRIIDEDSLYTVFYNAESKALNGEEANTVDIEAFRSNLTAFFDEKLEGIYRTEVINSNIDSAIESCVAIYSRYMHSDFFAKFHDLKQKTSKRTTAIIIISAIAIVLSTFLLRKMYHYKRHAFPYAVGGLVSAVIGNLVCIMVVLKSNWVSGSGIEPECYCSLAKSMTQYGGYVGLIVTGLIVIAICFMSYFINKSKRH